MIEAWQMTQAERQAEIETLRRDNHAILATPLASEGGISPYQIYRMGKRERERWQNDAQLKMSIMARIRQLARSDDDLKREHDEYTMKQNASKIASLNNRIEYLTRLGVGKSGKIKPSYQREIDKCNAELATFPGGK